MAASSSTVLVVAEAHPAPQLNTAFLRQPEIRLVRSARNDSALTLARRERPDLILDDVYAADDDALRICVELRRDAETRQIPVVLVVDAELESAARELDPAALLCRPIVPRELFEAVRQYVPLPPRRSERHPINLRFTFEHEGRMVQAFSRDLCLNGAFLKTDRTLRDGSHLALAFTLPGDVHEVRCGAVVCRNTENGCGGSRRGMGIEFEDIDDADLGRLEAFLERLDEPRSLFR